MLLIVLTKKGFRGILNFGRFHPICILFQKDITTFYCIKAIEIFKMRLTQYVPVQKSSKRTNNLLDPAKCSLTVLPAEPALSWLFV